ncbi:MAG: hypothetical protein ACFFD4_15825 [Candidatus Odinarchaeota archaeon]
MSSILTGAKETIQRIPWKEYFANILVKLLGILAIFLLLIGTLFLSEKINLDNYSVTDLNYILLIISSSACFLLVLGGFSKIILLDMADEFGLKDETTGKIVFNARFFFFAVLIISFCSAIYFLLDVFLGDAYLQLLVFIITDWILNYFNVNIEGLTDLSGELYYQTVRNIYFDFFFFVIVIFSVIVFLVLLTTFARVWIQKRVKEDEKKYEEEKNWFIKFFLWIITPFGLVAFSYAQTLFKDDPSYQFISQLFALVFLLLFVWWLYQLAKIIFRIIWRGLKVTAFITSINFLLIFPLIGVCYVAPVVLWSFWDIFFNPEFTGTLLSAFQTRALDIFSIVQLDFVFITIVATAVVGFAEGFAILAIFSALRRGAAVARTGRIVSRSPPRVVVMSKYLLVLGVWLGMVWNSLRGIWLMLLEEFNISLPDITIPRFFNIIYDRVIIPLSDWFNVNWPDFYFIPLLIIPVIFILGASFKFFSVTLVTPQVKDRLFTFFLLISTAFVLILTQILFDLHSMGVSDAPFLSVEGFVELIAHAVKVFEYVEALAFYAGFLFGLFWIGRKIYRGWKKQEPTAEVITKVESSANNQDSQ